MSKNATAERLDNARTDDHACSGTVSIDINNGKKVVDVPQGGSLLATLAEQKVFLPSACGGKGSCGQCKCRVLEGAEASSPPRPCTFRASR